jgi:hypothetical protein
MAFLSHVGMKLIFVTGNILVANVLQSEEANMGTETIIILMLMTFILGLVVGMILARPSHVH